MAKTTAQPDDEPTLDLYMVGIPLATYRALSDAAAAQGLTFAQGLAQAIGDFIRRGQPNPPEDDSHV